MDFLHDNDDDESNESSGSEEDSSSSEEEDDDYLQRMTNREKDTDAALSQLFLPKEKMEKMRAQLTNYIYADNVDHLRAGAHVRWICLKDPKHLELKKGAIFCYACNHCMCVCKTYMHRHIQFCFDDCLVFQRIDAKFQQLFDLLEFVSK
jgi:hypothetical protein